MTTQRCYKELRDHINILQENELNPLVRWQFRNVPEKERKAFLFENVTDVKGKEYNSSVLVGAHGASREIYALSIACKPEEITARLIEAQLHPLKPELITSGPVQEEIHMGENLLEHGGLEEFPMPLLSTPGFNNQARAALSRASGMRPLTTNCSNMIRASPPWWMSPCMEKA